MFLRLIFGGDRASGGGRSLIGSREGQVAIEFSFMMMLGFTFLIVLLSIATTVIVMKQESAKQEAVQSTADNIRRELLAAAMVRDGYERNFTIPLRIEGEDYTIISSEQVIELRTIDGHSGTVLVPSFEGSLKKGNNQIRRINGRIIIN